MTNREVNRGLDRSQSQNEEEGACVSVVMPTFNRAEALRSTIPCILEMDRVAEVIVVIDGSTDDTAAAIAEFSDDRLRVFSYENAGQPTARNLGVAHARFPWVLMADDDDWYPTDYASTLLQVAAITGASIVGAPWINVIGADSGELDELVARYRGRPAATFSFDTHPSTFPTTEIETPFLPARTLMRRDVFHEITYDPGYRGNAWREETSFFLSAVEAGFRVVLTPRTYTLHKHHWSGGATRSKLAYEYWTFRNNWRFLMKHDRWLRDHGCITSCASAQTAFVRGRLTSLASGWLRARMKRIQTESEALSNA